MLLRLLAGILMALFSAGSVMADEIVDKGKAAADLAANGKFLDAIEAADGVELLLWDRAPLTFRTALWVSEPPENFGAYNPRKTNEYASGEEMLAYAEPVGFGWRKSGEVWQTDFAADVLIKDKDGKDIFSQKKFQKFALTSHVRNHEVMTRFTVTVTGVPAGNYTVEITLRDAISGKSGSFSLPFVISNSGSVTLRAADRV